MCAARETPDYAEQNQRENAVSAHHVQVHFIETTRKTGIEADRHKRQEEHVKQSRRNVPDQRGA